MNFAIMEYHLALKIDDIKVYALTWKDVHDIFLCEKSKQQKACISDQMFVFKKELFVYASIEKNLGMLSSDFSMWHEG